MSYSAIPYDDVEIRIFSQHTLSQIEINIHESIKTVDNLFGTEEIETTKTVASFIPYIGQLVSKFVGMVAGDYDSQSTLIKTIADEIRRETIVNDLNLMEAAMETIQAKIGLLNETDSDSGKLIASQMQTGLDEMINFFARPDSIFKQNVLIVAPVLIQISLIVAVLEPVAETLIPLETKTIKLSCKTLDTLVAYRPMAVAERLDKLSDHSVEVRKAPFNPKGYNTTNSLDCIKGCPESSSCMTDEYGTSDYSASSGSNANCFIGYAQHVRHLVEKVFPTKLLERTCKRESQKPTGEAIFLLIYHENYSYIVYTKY